MNIIKKTNAVVISLLLGGISINALAAEYTPSSKILDIPIVKIGNNNVFNVKLKLKATGKTFGIVEYFDQPSGSMGSGGDEEYHPDSKILNIPKVKIDNGFVYDAKLKLNGANEFDIQGYSDQPAGGGANNTNAKCTPGHIKPEKFKQIETGMSMGQVDNIVGCKGTFQVASAGGDLYKWLGGEKRPFIQLVIKDGIVQDLLKLYIP